MISLIVFAPASATYVRLPPCPPLVTSTPNGLESGKSLGNRSTWSPVHWYICEPTSDFDVAAPLAPSRRYRCPACGSFTAPPVAASTPGVDSLVIISSWHPLRCPWLVFMQPLPIALMPSGPSTSGGADGSSVKYRELNPVVHAGVVEPQANLSTLPVCVRPAGPEPATPDSETHMLPLPSKVIPRGAANPPSTGVIDADGAACTAPALTSALATSAKIGTTAAAARLRTRPLAMTPP